MSRGGQGIVYQAVDTRIDRKVAIKVLRSRHPGVDAEARFQREAETISDMVSTR